MIAALSRQSPNKRVLRCGCALTWSRLCNLIAMWGSWLGERNYRRWEPIAFDPISFPSFLKGHPTHTLPSLQDIRPDHILYVGAFPPTYFVLRDGGNFFQSIRSMYHKLVSYHLSNLSITLHGLIIIDLQELGYSQPFLSYYYYYTRCARGKVVLINYSKLKVNYE